MENDEKVDNVEISIPENLAHEINRSLESFDKAKEHILNNYTLLIYYNQVNDQRMEKDEVQCVLDDPNLPSEDKIRIIQNIHESHNKERIKHEKETAEVAKKLMDASSKSIVRIVQGTFLGLLGGAVLWAAIDRNPKNVAKFLGGSTILGGTLGASDEVIHSALNGKAE